MLRRCSPPSGRAWMAAMIGLNACLAAGIVLLAAGSSGGVAAAAAAPAAAGAADPVYAALRAARPDGRVAAVHGLALDRDAFHLEFESGAFHFLAPVAGRTVGAVFLGHGTLRLQPPTAAERRQLALQLGEGKDFQGLADSFDELVLLFADDTAQEIGLAAPLETRAPDPRARQVYEGWLDRQRQDFHRNLQLRLLRDLLNRPGLTSGVFLGLLQGKKLPPSLLAVDPDGVGELLAGLRLGREPAMLLVQDQRRGGLWYVSDSRAGRELPRKRLARVTQYRVETTVLKDADLAGVTTIELEVLQAGLRVLPLQLMPKLRIAEAVYGVLPHAPATAGGGAASASGAAQPREPADSPEPEGRRTAAVVQEDAKQDGGDAAVVFPEPLAKGTRLLLRVAYHGDAVLVDAGDKNFVVEARSSWYPNLGVFADPAPFELTYRVPAGSQVISVGRLVGERTQGGQSVSEWKTDGGIRVAGFNYGQFKKLEQRDLDSGIDLAVFTNPGTPDIIRTINAIMESSGRRETAGMHIEGEVNSLPQATLGRVNTGRLAEAAMADGVNASRIFTTYFGPLAEKHVAITQQSQFAFGQSWPSLIFMPYISFLDGTQRQRLGLPTAVKDFVDQVGFHELAHQWWGHLVTADTYRDVWLEEGFAEFSAALAVQRTQGWAAYDHVWREARKVIFATPPHSAMANVDAGPITQGFRLSTERSPQAYQALVYYKGAYVLHMLRLYMWDGSNPSPDHRFIDMMRDYASTYAGKQASTADFQKVVERHMVPVMNATGDGKMDWFFRQWVYGTDAPRYVTDLHLEPAGDQVRIKGKVTQEGVADDFRGLVPISLDLDRGQAVRVGLLAMVGRVTMPVDTVVKPPRKPKRVLINAHGEVLARD